MSHEKESTQTLIDKRDWDRLLKKCTNAVLQICRNLQVPRSDVEDVCMEVVQKVWQAIEQGKYEHRPGLGSKSSFAAWVKVIATRTIYDHFRRSGPPLAVGGTDWQKATLQIDRPKGLNEGLESAPSLQDANLSEKELRILELKAFTTLTTSEISDELGLTDQSTKNLWTRVRGKLKEFFETEC